MHEAIDDFERALRIDPQHPEALIGLSQTLSNKALNAISANPPRTRSAPTLWLRKRCWRIPKTRKRIMPRPTASMCEAGKLTPRSPKLRPRSRTTATSPAAYAQAGFIKVFLGRADEGFAGVETALRLSPRDPGQ